MYKSSKNTPSCITLYLKYISVFPNLKIHNAYIYVSWHYSIINSTVKSKEKYVFNFSF